MIQIKAPDGSIAQFPDGTPDATIKSVMAKTYGGPKPQAAMSIPMQRATADAQKRLAGVSPQEMAIGQGFAFNLGDELDGGLAAGITGANNFIRKLTGRPDVGYGMSDAYQAVTAADRAKLAQFAQQHPVQNIAGSVLGAIANPLNRAAGQYVGGAGALPAAMARGAATGAATGAAYGAGAADQGSRLAGVAKGGAAGAVVGALAPPVAAGVGKVARAVAGGAQDLATGVKNTLAAPDPEAASTPIDTQTALTRLQQLMSRKGMSPEALESADPFGKGMTTAEAIGRPGVQSLGSFARVSGTTPDALEPILRERAMGAPDRILGDFASVAGIHPEEAAGDIESLSQRLQKEAGPLFDAVRAQPGPVWNQDLAQLAERPAIKKAIDAAGQSLLNAGKDPTAVGLQVDPDTGAFVLNSDLSKATDSYPTAEAWDKVRRMVNAMVQRDPVTGRVITTGEVGIKNNDLKTAAADLTRALAGDPANGEPGAIPGLRAALDKGGEYLSIESAFDRAQKSFLNPNVSAKQFSNIYAGLSEPEQKAWTAGVAAKLNDQLQRGRLTPNMLMLPHVQGKLSAVLGDEASQSLLPRLQAEAQLAATGGRMMPGNNSPTMEYLNALGEQEGGPNVWSMLGKAAKNPVGTAQDLIAQGRTIGTSPQFRNELGRLLYQPPQVTAQELASAPPAQVIPLIPRLPYGAISGTASSVAAQRK